MSIPVDQFVQKYMRPTAAPTQPSPNQKLYGTQAPYVEPRVVPLVPTAPNPLRPLAEEPKKKKKKNRLRQVGGEALHGLGEGAHILNEGLGLTQKYGALPIQGAIAKGELKIGLNQWTPEQKKAIAEATSFTQAARARQKNMNALEKIAVDIISDPSTWVTVGTVEGVAKLPMIARAMEESPFIFNLMTNVKSIVGAAQEAQALPITLPLKGAKTGITKVFPKAFDESAKTILHKDIKGALQAALNATDRGASILPGRTEKGVLDNEVSRGFQLGKLRGSRDTANIERNIDALNSMEGPARHTVLRRMQPEELNTLVTHLSATDPAAPDVVDFMKAQGLLHDVNLADTFKPAGVLARHETDLSKLNTKTHGKISLIEKVLRDDADTTRALKIVDRMTQRERHALLTYAEETPGFDPNNVIRNHLVQRKEAVFVPARSTLRLGAEEAVPTPTLPKPSEAVPAVAPAVETAIPTVEKPSAANPTKRLVQTSEGFVPAESAPSLSVVDEKIVPTKARPPLTPELQRTADDLLDKLRGNQVTQNLSKNPRKTGLRDVRPILESMDTKDLEQMALGLDPTTHRPLLNQIDKAMGKRLGLAQESIVRQPHRLTDAYQPGAPTTREINPELANRPDIYNATTHRVGAPVVSGVAEGPHRSNYLSQLTDTLKSLEADPDEITAAVLLTDTAVQALTRRNILFPTSESVFATLNIEHLPQNMADESNIITHLPENMLGITAPTAIATSKHPVDLVKSLIEMFDFAGTKFGTGTSPFTTYSHEFAHVLRNMLPDNDLQTIADALGLKSIHDIGEQQEEAIALSFEKFLQSGKLAAGAKVAGNTRLAEIYQNVFDMMKQTWQFLITTLRPGMPNKGVVNFWDEFFKTAEGATPMFSRDPIALMLGETGARLTENDAMLQDFAPLFEKARQSTEGKMVGLVGAGERRARPQFSTINQTNTMPDLVQPTTQKQADKIVAANQNIDNYVDHAVNSVVSTGGSAPNAQMVKDALKTAATRNPDHFSAQTLLTNKYIAEPFIKAIQAETPQEARTYMAMTFTRMNLQRSAAGVMHPVAMRLWDAVVPSTMATRDVGTPIVTHGVQNAVISDRDMDFLTRMYTSDTVQDLQKTYEEMHDAVDEVMNKYALSQVTDTTTAGDMWDALDKNIITDKADRKIVESFLNKFGMTPAAAEKLTKSKLMARAGGLTEEKVRNYTTGQAFMDTAIDAWAKERAAELGIKAWKPGNNLLATLAWVPKAWREQALLSPRYHLANWMDMITRGAIYGVNPLRARGSAQEQVSKWGIRMPEELRIGGGTARNLSDLSSLPDFVTTQANTALPGPLSPIVRLNRAIARGSENVVRGWAWANGAKDYMTAYRPEFYGNIEQQLPGQVGKDVIERLASRGDNWNRNVGIDFSADEVYNLVIEQGGSAEAANNLANIWSSALDEGAHAGVQFANKVQLDFDTSYNIEDKLWLSKWLPFHFFATRNIPFYLETLAAHPEIVNAWQAYQDVSEQDRIDLGLPSRYKGYIPIGDGFLAGLFGPGQVFFNPLATISMFDQTKNLMSGNTDPNADTEPFIGQALDKLSNVGLGVAPWVQIPMSVVGIYGPNDEPMPIFRWSGIVEDVTGKDLMGEGLVRKFENAGRAVATGKKVDTFTGSQMRDNQIVSKLQDQMMDMIASNPNVDPDFIRQQFIQASREGPDNILWQEAANEVRHDRLHRDISTFINPLPSKAVSPTRLETQKSQDDLYSNVPPQLLGDKRFIEMARLGKNAAANVQGFQRPKAVSTSSQSDETATAASGASDLFTWGGTIWGPDKPPPFNNKYLMENYGKWVQTQPVGHKSPEDFLAAFNIPY